MLYFTERSKTFFSFFFDELSTVIETRVVVQLGKGNEYIWV